MLRKLSLLLAIMLVIGLVTFFVFPEKTSPLTSSNQAVESTQLTQPSLDAPSELLSSDVSFPTPVIQLQQTIAHGLVEAERVDLPLLSGELAEFSQKNISEEYPSPPELENLKQRLKKLQSLSQ
ncbi:hypothetical protein [Vibrio europaeus]|uniref:hypothetical protein n=1 Tax=Vibrio europaeus TaxID=300876 RepID=UPI00148E5844|nr:hypothetical protein [Vibrio europaeus]NOH22829.1 hypothetical protein [Vibrio europaeus]